MDTKNLLQKVRDELEKTKGRWPEVAQGAGVNYFTVVRMSKPPYSPRYETLAKVANHFGIPC